MLFLNQVILDFKYVYQFLKRFLSEDVYQNATSEFMPNKVPSPNKLRGLIIMSTNCVHLDQIKDVTPSANGCEECLKMGDT